MDLTLPAEDLAWQARAKAFAETVLFPQELELEMNGSLPQATKDALRAAVVANGFNGINHAREVGGQGCTQLPANADQRGARQGDQRVVGRWSGIRRCRSSRARPSRSAIS
jgi:alkylation response protein AidB-like acyl-CoA dehydrogenase